MPTSTFRARTSSSNCVSLQARNRHTRRLSSDGSLSDRRQAHGLRNPRDPVTPQIGAGRRAVRDEHVGTRSGIYYRRTRSPATFCLGSFGIDGNLIFTQTASYRLLCHGLLITKQTCQAGITARGLQTKLHVLPTLNQTSTKADIYRTKAQTIPRGETAENCPSCDTTAQPTEYLQAQTH